MQEHTIIGGGGVRLHAREWGRADGPELLFIHGWSQCHMCWDMQTQSHLAEQFRIVAVDLRGHGMSDKPLDPDAYTDGRLWADDIAAVMSGLRLKRPVFVAWSYGGLVVCDYLRHYGDREIAGINFVSAATTLTPEAFGTLIGPGFYEPFGDATGEDLPRNIAAMRRFLRGVTHRPLPDDLFETALCWNMVVPPGVRRALGARSLDNDDVLAGLRVPVTVSHGEKDQVVLPAMSEHILETCKTASASWYASVGHAAMMEDAERFNKELLGLVAEV